MNAAMTASICTMPLQHREPVVLPGAGGSVLLDISGYPGIYCHARSAISDPHRHLQAGKILLCGFIKKPNCKT